MASRLCDIENGTVTPTICLVPLPDETVAKILRARLTGIPKLVAKVTPALANENQIIEIETMKSKRNSLCRSFTFRRGQRRKKH